MSNTNGDYISREAAIKQFSERLPNIGDEYICKIAEEIPAADVQPVALINAGIETALQILDGIIEEGWMPYPVYSELHDAISVIGECAQNGADMREVKTDV